MRPRWKYAFFFLFFFSLDNEYEIKKGEREMDGKLPHHS